MIIFAYILKCLCYLAAFLLAQRYYVSLAPTRQVCLIADPSQVLARYETDRNSVLSLSLSLSSTARAFLIARDQIDICLFLFSWNYEKINRMSQNFVCINGCSWGPPFQKLDVYLSHNLQSQTKVLGHLALSREFRVKTPLPSTAMLEDAESVTPEFTTTCSSISLANFNSRF